MNNNPDSVILREDTKVVVSGRDSKSFGGMVNPPVYHGSTVLAESVAEYNTRHDSRLNDEQVMVYGTMGNPTGWALENAIAELEGGYNCATYSSGLAAIAVALMAFLKSGDHLLMTDSTYAPTRRFCDSVLKRFGVETTYYDPLIGAEIKSLLRPNTAVVFTESPGSHTFEVQDIPSIAEVAHQHGAIVQMDNTWASPLYFKPFEHGVDISIQAVTKYIVGHSDVLLGSVTTTKEHWKTLRDCTWHFGQCVAPDDLYLAQRGLRTMAVRLRQHHKSSLKIAEWLSNRAEVRQVLYPALPGAPGHEIWKRDFLGASGLFGVELKPFSQKAVEKMIDEMRLFGIGSSWGGYESLMLPSNVRDIRTASPWRFEGPLLRLHIGLEDVDDLKDDLKDGLERIRNFGG
ncbi:MAG: cystathionine beta-lyase [SAR324 cluster bacterium]|nr:cystathionine beta-lyase [SAR324 cluster bacterium]MBL7036026.1 cystathionine beta-lyase [SAR324 cluster bacterium]